jgi:hypothetical protein
VTARSLVSNQAGGKKLKTVAVYVIAVAATLFTSIAAAQEQFRTWNFSVLLDGSKIGYHTFRVRGDKTLKEVSSEAKFDVKFLFLNAFRYRHSNTETWLGDCLLELDASTNSNGKRFEINGSKTGGSFLVEANAEEKELPGCVMTFAYWNPDFLQQERLLNPQSGEYLDVDVEELGSQSINVRGENVAAQAFRVSAKEMELKLWYSDRGDWLALESKAKGGRIIRYELT